MMLVEGIQHRTSLHLIYSTPKVTFILLKVTLDAVNYFNLHYTNPAEVQLFRRCLSGEVDI
jgi:hypothetical protein